MGILLKKIFIITAGIVFVSLSLYAGRNTLPFKLNELLRESNSIRQEFQNYSKAFDDEYSFYILISSKNVIPENEIHNVLSTVHSVFKRSNLSGSLKSLHSEEYLAIQDDYFHLIPFISNKGEFSKEAKIELSIDFYKNTLISKNEKSLLIAGAFRNFKNIKDERSSMKEFLALLKKINSNHPDFEFHSLGTKVAQYYYFLDTIKNQVILTPILFLCLGILIYYLFRSFKVLMLFSSIMMVSYGSVIYLIAFHEGGISSYSGFAMFFVLIIATSDLVHFFSVYLNSSSTSIQFKLQKVREEVFMPCLLTTLTTALSFLSLLPNSIVPISNLGLYASFGACVCFIFTFYFLPFLINLFQFQQKKTDYLPTFKTAKVLEWVIRRPLYTVFLFSFSLLFFSFNAKDLTIDDNFYDKFTREHPLTKSVHKFQKEFSFLGNVDLSYNLTDKKSKITDPRIHKSILNFEKEVTELQEISYVKSYNGFYQYLRDKFNHVEENKEARIESLSSMMVNYGAFSTFYHIRHNIYRSVVFLNTTSSKKANQLIKKVNTIALKYSEQFTINFRGFISLRNYVFNKLVINFLISISFSFMAIFFIFWFIFKSFKWACFGMLPNLLPLVLICGSLSIFNMSIDSNLVLMVCITLGIAVDDTIHFLWALKKNLNKGLIMVDAIRKAFNKTSKALLGTTLIFSLSFPSFFFADLKIFSQVGTFVILSLVFALAVDLFLLPALFLVKKNKTTG